MKLFGKKIRKTFICIAMAFVVVTASVMTYQIPVHAETVKTGMITGDGVNFRKGPGTSYASLGKYNYGKTGTYLGEGTASNGKLWYNLKIDGVSGWVHSDYVKIITAESSDAAFEAYLTSQGFPEDYKQSLRVLHEQYPNWIFEAQHTNLDWNTVIAEESKLGRNLVHSSAETSWKSTADGAYNWETGEWKVFDSGGWVAASTEIIEYYMDPRNFLGTNTIFQFLKQSYDASTADTTAVRNNLKGMVTGTFLAKGYDGKPEAYLDDIMNAAATNKVSPYVLAAMILQEQGTDGDSGNISGTNSTYGEEYVGYYNFFNIGAYKTSTMEATERGLWYASGSGKGETSYYRPWNTRAASIMGGSQHYGEGFVSVGQDTMYLKKFDLVGTLYTHQYMTNVGGGYSEGLFMARAYNETARQSALVFKIPVFKNMPGQPCQKPTGNSNPNYMLTALSVSGYSLTPSFSMYEQTYSLIVPNSVSSVTISATPASSTAKVTGTGTKSLNVGNNTATIKVTAENGTERTYTITIVRNSAQTQTLPTLSSSTYKIAGTTVTGIQPGVSASTLKKNLSASENGSMKVLTASGSENTGTVGTGNIIRVSNGAGSKDYTVVIYGDTSGDGKVTSLDLLQLKRHIVKTSSLNGVYATAADTSKDGKITSLDLLQVKRHIVKAAQIQQ